MRVLEGRISFEIEMRDAYGRGIFKLLVKRPIGFKMFGCGFGRWGAR